MIELEDIDPPDDFDWQYWVESWDRMQERYLVKRTERFELIARLLRETQGRGGTVLDLGCGTGSLMLTALEALPEAEVVGVDFDPALLWLAKARLARFGDRSRLVLADLRSSSWTREVPSPLDAAVSATALHWFEADQLVSLYRRIAQLLRPRAIFLNADHVGSDCADIQRARELRREEALSRQTDSRSRSWDEFWGGYSRALGLDTREIHQRISEDWGGKTEEGLPLAWHLDRLREAGFASVDCFWRTDCDAIYGGIRG